MHRTVQKICPTKSHRYQDATKESIWKYYLPEGDDERVFTVVRMDIFSVLLPEWRCHRQPAADV